MKKVPLTLQYMLLVSHLFLHAGTREVVFIGLTSDGAPSIEQTFDKLIRDQLAVQPNIVLCDYLQTQHYSRLIRFRDFPIVSRNLVESIEKLASDTTLFIWGTITNASVTPERKHLILALLKGEMNVKLTIYSLEKKEYAYTGNIHTEVTKLKGIILTRSVTSTVHANAIEKSNLIDECATQTVRKTIGIINAVVRNLSTGDVATALSTDVEAYKVPSISDVFLVPSIEAREIKSESDSLDTLNESDRNE